MVEGFQRFAMACGEIGYALLAILEHRFPLFLVPSQEVRRARLEDEYTVRIFRGVRDGTWYLRDSRNNRDLFSFDLPQDLFLQYANQGMLSREAAAQMKEEWMSNFQAIVVEGRRARIVSFQLDEEWLAGIRDLAAARKPRRRRLG